jgi:aspartate aminotransferase/aminotransferase
MAGVAQAFAAAPHSGIREMATLASRLPDALRLEAGDPNFATPDHILDGAAQAAAGGFTKYTPSNGFPALRELIAAKLIERNELDATVDSVVVTTGGCGGLFTTLLVLLDPGDEVLVPDPGWANYAPMISVQSATSVGYPLDPARGWDPDLERLEALITPRSKVLIVNSPGNPTGAVYSRETLSALIELAQRHDLWIISDECYDEILFEGEHVSMARLGDPERVISVFTFSKSYAMTGWRVGYAAATPDLAEKISKAQEPVVGNASSVSQKAAEVALSGPQDCVAEMRDAYRERRDASIALLDSRGIGYVHPNGAFYVMVDVSAACGGDSLAFARQLLEEEHVSVVPGSAFGPTGEGFVRVSLSVDPGVLSEALERLAGTLEREA